MILEHL